MQQMFAMDYMHVKFAILFWKASRWKDHAYLRTFFQFYASKPAKDARLCEKFYFTRFFQIMRIFKKQHFMLKIMLA